MTGQQPGDRDDATVPPPVYPPAAVPEPPHEPGDEADDVPDAAAEAGLPDNWPVLPPVD